MWSALHCGIRYFAQSAQYGYCDCQTCEIMNTHAQEINETFFLNEVMFRFYIKLNTNLYTFLKTVRSGS